LHCSASKRVFTLLIALAVLFVILEPASATAVGITPRQDAGKRLKTVWDGVYTIAQAARGNAQYDLNCARCHSTGEAPSIIGDAFMRRWFENDLNVMLMKMRTMPADAPGSLADNVYIDIASFLLRASGFPQGPEELGQSPEQLANILVVDKAGAGGPVPNYLLVLVPGTKRRRMDTHQQHRAGQSPGNWRFEAGRAARLGI
jgi:hypothetical protein